MLRLVQVTSVAQSLFRGFEFVLFPGIPSLEAQKRRAHSTAHARKFEGKFSEGIYAPYRLCRNFRNHSPKAPTCSPNPRSS